MVALALLALLLGSAHAQQQQQQQHWTQPGFGAATRVVVIGIDGCRSDLIGSAAAPTLQRLLAEGSSTINARKCADCLSDS